MTTCFDVLAGAFELVGTEGFEFSSGDTVTPHEIFRKCFGAFHPGSENIGAKDGDANLESFYKIVIDMNFVGKLTIAEVGFDTVDQGLFRTRNNKIDLLRKG